MLIPLHPLEYLSTIYSFRDRLPDLRLLREGARQAAKETARSVRQRRLKSDVWTLKMLHRVVY